MFDLGLIKDINRGKRFVLVGSGPSTEMGYSSRARLAKNVFEYVKKLGKVSDEAGYLKIPGVKTSIRRFSLWLNAI